MEAVEADYLSALGLEDVLVSIFRFLDPSALEHTIPLVCKCWNSLQLDGVWQVIVQEHLPERFWENRPSGKSNKECMRFDPALQWDRRFYPQLPLIDPDLVYEEDNFRVKKLVHNPDTNVALVSRKINAGQTAFCEFLIEVLGDEFLVGVTNNGEGIKEKSGYSLINHPHTWAFWDNRVGLQFGGTKIPVDRTVHRYRSGDRIGILLNMEERTIEFFHNDKSVGKAENLPLEVEVPVTQAGEEYDTPATKTITAVYQFFAMLDYENDVAVIHKFY